MTFKKMSQINFYPEKFFFIAAIDINLILILKILFLTNLVVEVKG